MGGVLSRTGVRGVILGVARLSTDRVREIVRGKSGQHREGQSLTATERELRESATETIPPRSSFGCKRGKGEKREVRAR